MTAREKREKISKIVSKVLFILIILLITYIATKVIIGLVTKQPIGLFGHYMFMVRSESMEPNISVGDMIIVKKINIAKIKIGDVVSFTCINPSEPIYGEKVIHRVVEINNDAGNISFIVKGDNNPANDDFAVTGDNFFGKVVLSSSFLGLIFDKVNATYLLVFIVVIVMLLDFIVKQIKKVANYIKEQKQEDEKERIRQEILDQVKKEKGE